MGFERLASEKHQYLNVTINLLIFKTGLVQYTKNTEGINYKTNKASKELEHTSRQRELKVSPSRRSQIKEIEFLSQ